jgi:hypothetical protein
MAERAAKRSIRYPATTHSVPIQSKSLIRARISRGILSISCRIPKWQVAGDAMLSNKESAIKLFATLFICDFCGMRYILRGGCQPLYRNWMVASEDEISSNRLLIGLMPSG